MYTSLFTIYLNAHIIARSARQHSGVCTLSVDGEGGRCDCPTDRDRCCVQEVTDLVRAVVTDNPLPERVYAGWRQAAECGAAALDAGKTGAEYEGGLKMWGQHPCGSVLRAWQTWTSLVTSLANHDPWGVAGISRAVGYRHLKGGGQDMRWCRCLPWVHRDHRVLREGPWRMVSQSLARRL